MSYFVAEEPVGFDDIRFCQVYDAVFPVYSLSLDPHSAVEVVYRFESVASVMVATGEFFLY